MKCPICGRVLPPNTDRCPDCGYRCRSGVVQSQPASYYTPPNQTKKSRGCCCALIIVVPLLLGLIAAIIGVTNYVLEEFSLEDYGFEYFEDTPFEDRVPADPPAEADEGCFSIRDGAVTFHPDRWDGERVLRVPETVDGETVTEIAPGCFRNCTEITTILLPDTVTSIGKEAFAGCSSLLGMYFPEGMDSIGPRSFAGCINMESVYVPSSVTQIAPGCFDDCAALLYLFYDGDFESWDALYSDYINPFTTAICLDGEYYHGAGG